MRAQRASPKPKLMVVLMLSALLALPAAVQAQSSGECLRVEVPASVVLPDGTTRDPGTLRICATRHFSPVSTLHETSVDGTAVGLLLSRRGKTEGLVKEMPFVLFESSGGRFRLIGYAWPNGDAGMATYRFTEPERPGAVARDSGRLPVEGDSIVLLIARVE